jgi:predicted histone-like DNA-binding protein
LSKTQKKKDITGNPAKRIRAISTYSPRINQPKTADMRDLVTLIAARSSLNEGDIFHVLKELGGVIPYFLQQGRAVKVDSLGTFTLRIAMDGSFSISHLPDTNLKNAINTPRWFNGTIKNKDMIGKTPDDLVERWNTEHPDEPIE